VTTVTCAGGGEGVLNLSYQARAPILYFRSSTYRPSAPAENDLDLPFVFYGLTLTLICVKQA
jgi:hypothetical protein